MTGGIIRECSYCGTVQSCDIQETSTEPLYFCVDTITCAFLVWYKKHILPESRIARPVGLITEGLMNYEVLHRVNHAVLPPPAFSWLARALEIENWKEE